MQQPDFSSFDFHPVVLLGEAYSVLDFSEGIPKTQSNATFTIGKYNEDRKNMYTADIFAGQRTIHMGIDIGGPVGTPIHAFFDGVIYDFGINDAPGDYGPTLVTAHDLGGVKLYALYGHLASQSLVNKKRHATFSKGDVLAFIGDDKENGGWPPHLHFQLCLQAPSSFDMPGVVAPQDLAEARKLYPDPQLILGKLY